MGCAREHDWPWRMALRNCRRRRSDEDDETDGGVAWDVADQFRPGRFDGELRHSANSERTLHLHRFVRPSSAYTGWRPARSHRLPRLPASILRGAHVLSEFLQCAFEAGLCRKIRINATITTRSANDAV